MRIQFKSEKEDGINNMAALKTKRVNEHIGLAIFDQTIKVDCSGNSLFFGCKVANFPTMFIPSLIVVLQDVFQAGKDAKAEEINNKIIELQRLIS